MIALIEVMKCIVVHVNVHRICILVTSLVNVSISQKYAMVSRIARMEPMKVHSVVSRADVLNSSNRSEGCIIMRIDQLNYFSWFRFEFIRMKID